MDPPFFSFSLFLSSSFVTINTNSDDIDAILAHGEQRTEEMNKMVTSSMENNLQNFTLDGKSERE